MNRLSQTILTSSRGASADTLIWKMSLSAGYQDDLLIFWNKTTGQVQFFSLVFSCVPRKSVPVSDFPLLIIIKMQEDLSIEDWKLVVKLKAILKIQWEGPPPHPPDHESATAWKQDSADNLGRLTVLISAVKFGSCEAEVLWRHIHLYTGVPQGGLPILIRFGFCNLLGRRIILQPHSVITWKMRFCAVP